MKIQCESFKNFSTKATSGKWWRHVNGVGHKMWLHFRLLLSGSLLKQYWPRASNLWIHPLIMMHFYVIFRLSCEMSRSRLNPEEVDDSQMGATTPSTLLFQKCSIWFYWWTQNHALVTGKAHLRREKKSNFILFSLSHSVSRAPVSCLLTKGLWWKPRGYHVKRNFSDLGKTSRCGFGDQETRSGFIRFCEEMRWRHH